MSFAIHPSKKHPPEVFTQGGKTKKAFDPMALKYVFLILKTYFLKKCFLNQKHVVGYGARRFLRRGGPSAWPLCPPLVPNGPWSPIKPACRPLASLFRDDPDAQPPVHCGQRWTVGWKTFCWIRTYEKNPNAVRKPLGVDYWTKQGGKAYVVGLHPLQSPHH